jgi:hypothetical protein
VEGADGVVDAEATHGAGGVMGAAWGVAKGMGATWGADEVDEACDKEAAKGRAVRPPGVAVRPPATVLRAV